MSESVDDRFLPAEVGHHPLFLDTSALYAYFYEGAAQHDEMSRFFEALGANALPYRPLLTNQYVLDELVSLLLSDAGHDAAADAVDALLESTALTVRSVGDEAFTDAVEQFRTSDDQDISLTDYTIALQATQHDADHVLTYDGDFRTLDLVTVPRDS